MFTDEDLVYLRRTIIEAGRAIMDIYEKDAMDVQKKSDQSPVTAADLAADDIIYNALSSRFGDRRIVTEERQASHEALADGAKADFFIIDPLDGTKEFVNRRGDFTVNIGYVAGGIPVFGMVYAPAKARLFYTHNGKAYEESGDFDLEAQGEVKPISVANADNRALKIVASKSHRDQATDDYIAAYEVADFLAAGSSLKFCLVATGEADFYPRLGPTMEWDTAAADAVVRAAGGEVLDFETEQVFQYGKPEFRNGFFLVKAPNVELKRP